MINKIIMKIPYLALLCFVVAFPIRCQSDEILDPVKEINESEQLIVVEEYGDAIVILRNLERFLIRPEYTNNKKNEYLTTTRYLLGVCYLKLRQSYSNKIAGNLFREVLKIDPKYEVSKTPYGEDVVQLFEKVREDFNKKITDKTEEIQMLSKKEDTKAAGKIPSKGQTPTKNASSIAAAKGTTPARIQVRVIKEDAVLKLMPDDKSQTIRKIPLGSQLDIKEIMEEWIKVKLPPNQDGVVISGYMRIEFVELESQYSVFYLNDGTIIKGEVIEANVSFIVVRTSLGKVNISRKDILKAEGFEYR